MTQPIEQIVEQMREAAEAATWAPWTAKREDTIFPIRGREGERIGLMDFGTGRQEQDARHIAAANPANILAILDALKEAQERADELQGLLVTADICQDRLRAERDALAARAETLEDLVLRSAEVIGFYAPSSEAALLAELRSALGNTHQ